jgi:FkbM family methyltransferase
VVVGGRGNGEEERVLRGFRRRGKELLLRHRPGWFWGYVKWRHGFLEPEMALLPRLCRPDRVSVDVGANYGIYSYYLSQYSSSCISFEPYPHLAGLLRKGLGSSIEVHEVALSDRSGTTELRAVPETTGLNTIEPTNPLESKVPKHGGIQVIQVRVRRLDEFELQDVGFVKIDVEGHEHEVLAGATNTLVESRPAILVEVEERHRKGSIDRTKSMLVSLDYRGFYLREGNLRPVETFEPSRNQNLALPDEYIRNFIFLPEHRLADFADMITEA